MNHDVLTSSPMRDAETLQRPAFSVPEGSCDVHMHAFGPLERYRPVARPHYTLPDGRLNYYQRLMDVLGLQRFVIVQPSFYGTDNACLIDSLQAAGPVARGVIMVEAEHPDDDLLRLDSLGVRAVRLDLFKRAEEPLEEIKAYVQAMAAKVQRRGWHLQFYTPGWLVRKLTDFLATLPVDYVIDHMGYMLAEDGLTEADFARLLDLTRSSRCWLKLSGPYRIAKTGGYAAVRHVARAIVEAAPERTIWGSDWPHIPDSSRDTGELLNLMPEWAPDADIRKLILVNNPARLFGFPTKP
jgi:predicted TIM-barrel fold metal-dependent hydrolase